jgi:hypothetical protein
MIVDCGNGHLLTNDYGCGVLMGFIPFSGDNYGCGEGYEDGSGRGFGLTGSTLGSGTGMGFGETHGNGFTPDGSTQ